MNGLVLASYVLKSHLGRIDADHDTTRRGGRVLRTAGLLSVAIVIVAIATLGGTA